MPVCSRRSRMIAKRGEVVKGAHAARVWPGELDNPDGNLEGFGSHELAVDNSIMHTLGLSCHNNKNTEHYLVGNKNNYGLNKYPIKVAVEEEKFLIGREGKFCTAMLSLKCFIF